MSSVKPGKLSWCVDEVLRGWHSREVTDDEPRPSWRRPPDGGFASRPAVEAAQRIADTQEAALAALPLDLAPPSPDEAAEGVVTHFVYQDSRQGWTVRGQVSRGPSGLIISKLEIWPGGQKGEPSGGVTAGLLRRIPVGEMLSSVRAQAAWEAARREGTRKILGEEPAEGMFAETDSTVRHGGRTPLSDDLLLSVALAYLEETAPGKDRRVLKRLSERFDRPEETIRTWIARARKAGWLGPGSKGRPGAEPGPRLLLRQMEGTTPWGSARNPSDEEERKEDET